MTRRWFLGLALLAAGGIVAAGQWWPQAQEDDRSRTLIVSAEWRDVKAKDIEDLVTPAGLAVVHGADRVEFLKQHIDFHPGSDWNIERRQVGSAADLAAARDALLSPDIYSWDRRGGHKRCGGFQPRDAVRFWRGNESVTFLICFTCLDLGVVYHDGDGRARPWIIADSHPGKAKLHELMNRVYPDAVTPDP